MSDEDRVVRLRTQGEPPDGGDRDGRLRGIEDRLTHIETKFDHELRHLATKEDVGEIKTLIARKEATHLRWLLGVLVTATISLITAAVSVLVVMVRMFGA